MYNNTTGAQNTAVGSQALNSNTTASSNTAVGYQALYSNTTASNNTALGYGAGYSNTTGTQSTASGAYALYLSTTGSYNTAFGYGAGYTNVSGSNNTFVGRQAGFYSTGGDNTFIGYYAGGEVTSGAKNTILGKYNGNQGGLDIRTSSNYIVESDGDGNPRWYWDGTNWNISGTTATSNTGNILFKNNSQTTYWRIASDSSNWYLTNGNFSSYCYVSQSFGSWAFGSDRRIKTNIVDLNYGLAEVLQIQPRRYNLISDNSEQIGFVAQELQTVIPEAVIGSEVPFADTDTPQEKAQKTMGVSKDYLIPVLVKAIQEQQAIIESLKARLDAANL
jgi:hypothetical protein